MKTIAAIILIFAVIELVRGNDEKSAPLYNGAKPKSCLEIKYADPSINKNGVYTVFTTKHVPFKVYCDFTTDAPYIWTLIESFSRDYGLYRSKLPSAWKFQRPYTINAPYNDDNPTNWEAHRLSLTMIRSIDSSETTHYFRATCNFNDFANNVTKDIDRDNYLRENTCDTPITKLQAYGCHYFDYVVVRGYACVRCYFPFWASTSIHPTFLSSHTVRYCGKYKFPESSPSHQESDFGHYNGYSTRHSCSAYGHSTANWWLGGLYLTDSHSMV